MSRTPKKPFIRQPSTVVANTLIDELWPILSDKAKAVLVVIVRYTDGWHHQERVMLSVPDLMRLTGSTNKGTVEKALKWLLD